MDGYGIAPKRKKDAIGLGKTIALCGKEGWDGSLKEGWDDRTNVLEAWDF